MATGGAVCRYTADSPQETEEMSHSETDTLHERLVAYVHTLAHGSRRGVWGEHSYARARIGGGARGAGRVRALLAPRPPAPAPALLDVEAAPAPAPEPPAPAAAPAAPPSDDDDTDASDEEWEPRVAALAPDAAHARLAADAADALRAMRLERLARPGRAARREQARGAARRLRAALAPLWAAGAAPAWLHAALAAHLPRGARRLYDEALAELRRALPPALAARLTGEPGPAPAPVAARGAVGPESSPWLVWVSSGCAALDERWERRLAELVHTRVLRGAGGAPGAPAAPPEPWCAAAAGAVRAALTDALAEAGSRSVILGGVGAGAAAALVLARGAGGAGGAGGGVRGAVLCAPPLLTAEGARDARDDALHACRLPLLLVVGTAAADCARSVANNVAESAPARRLLEVRGADSQLRLPRRLRERHALPQHALDAALAEECVRWAVETAETEEAPAEPPAPPAPPPARRAPLPALVHSIDLCADEEYSHLPPATPLPAPPTPPAAAATPPAPAAPPPAPAALNARTLEVVEGRVVSRGCGGTPLALVPPRRAGGVAGGAGGVAGGALAAADIMQLPIVFADDERTLPAATASESSPSGSPVTVTSGKSTKRGAPDGGAGSVKFTRVILAKRGARGAGAPGAERGAPRRLLLRRGVRLVPRAQD